MSTTETTPLPLARPDRFFAGGEWVAPSSTDTIEVVEAATEAPFYRIAAAREADVDRAVTAARTAFDDGPWPRLTPTERAGYLRAIGEGIRARVDEFAALWPRESGILHRSAAGWLATIPSIYADHADHADLAATFPFEIEIAPTDGLGGHGLVAREPVGVVGAIIPWNAPMQLIAFKIAPALLCGCTVVLKSAPEAPGAAYLVAEIAQEAGLPPGVLNVVTAGRDVSEGLVRDPRVDKIAFTGSTVAGRRIASLLGERIGRYTLELGGKSAAIVLDDADLGQAAEAIAGAECTLTGQVCSSLTRIVVPRRRHDALVEALAASFAAKRVGDPFDPTVDMGPLVARRQRDRVEAYIAAGVADGARLATGGGRPAHLDRGWFVEPTVFGDVDGRSRLGQEEVFGPVLAVVPAVDEQDAVRLADDTIYGLNASVFTPDVDRVRAVAARLRSGTVAQNAFRNDYGLGFGGFKQSGIGREGGPDGLAPYLENKSVLLDGVPSSGR